jgi:hypothetical protein
MNYEIITVNEYFGNNLERTRQAKLYKNGTLEFLPEPVYEDDEEDNEEEVLCMKSQTR